MPLSELNLLPTKEPQSVTDIQHDSVSISAINLSFDEKVLVLKNFFLQSNFSKIRDALLQEGFAEIEMEEGIEEIVDGHTVLQFIQISCPSHVYNFGLNVSSWIGDAPYHLGFQDLRTAISSVWNTDVLCDENREAIVNFLYKTFII